MFVSLRDDFAERAAVTLPARLVDEPLGSHGKDGWQE
jgi:hypothetical protein